MSGVKALLEPALVGIMSGVSLLILFAVVNGATRLVFGRSIQSATIELAGGAKSTLGEVF